MVWGTPTNKGQGNAPFVELEKPVGCKYFYDHKGHYYLAQWVKGEWALYKSGSDSFFYVGKVKLPKDSTVKSIYDEAQRIKRETFNRKQL